MCHSESITNTYNPTYARGSAVQSHQRSTRHTGTNYHECSLRPSANQSHPNRLENSPNSFVDGAARAAFHVVLENTTLVALSAHGVEHVVIQAKCRGHGRSPPRLSCGLLAQECSEDQECYGSIKNQCRTIQLSLECTQTK